MKNLINTFAILACLCGACACSLRMEKSLPADERFIRVAENPQKFDGQEVTFRAWITLRHEDKNLWATMNDQSSWNTLRCLSLINYDSLSGLEPDLDGRVVEVTGTVVGDASRGGKLLRLGACRDVAIEISGASAIRLVP